MATKTTKKPRTRKAAKKEAAADLLYQKLNDKYWHLSGHYIYPGDTVVIQPTTDVGIGDLVVLEKLTKDAWTHGVYLGISQGKLELAIDREDGTSSTICRSTADYKVLGRIIAADAFRDARYVEAPPSEAADRLGVPSSHLVMWRRPKAPENLDLSFRKVTLNSWAGLGINAGDTVGIEETADVGAGDLIAVVTLGDEAEWTMGVLQKITPDQIVLACNTREGGPKVFTEPRSQKRILGRIVATYEHFDQSDLVM